LKLRMRQSIARALADEMAADPTVIVMGEDIAEAEGPFKTSEGLLKQFGAGIPIAAGAALSAPVTGGDHCATAVFGDGATNSVRRGFEPGVDLEVAGRARVREQHLR